MRPNKLRELLRAGKPSVGTHLHSIWPSLVEIVGHTGGYDYIEFSGEYAPYDMYGLEHWCRAAELMDLGTLIKLDQEPRTWLAQRAIGAGFQATLFADIHSPEEAAEGVRAVRPDTPGGGGIYGATDRRHSYWGYGGSQAFVDALKDIVVMVMIEKREAVERLDEILAVPGIDMVQWGPVGLRDEHRQARRLEPPRGQEDASCRCSNAAWRSGSSREPRSTIPRRRGPTSRWASSTSASAPTP